jgi:hypothetical protein
MSHTQPDWIYGLKARVRTRHDASLQPASLRWNRNLWRCHRLMNAYRRAASSACASDGCR